MGRIPDKSLIQILSVIVFKDLLPKKMRRNRTEKVLEKIGKIRSRVSKCLNLHDVIYQQPLAHRTSSEMFSGTHSPLTLYLKKNTLE